jgi:polysaccharide deacetylase family protein (PEP-CTERM system associated)
MRCRTSGTGSSPWVTTMSSDAREERGTLGHMLTVDLEDWYHSNLRSWSPEDGCVHEVRVVENTHRLLKLFEQHHAKATFFVLGSIADDHPGLVREVASAGHEIASHGYGHRLVHEMTRAEFKDDVAGAKARLEDIVGRRVKGYRAPSWSIDEHTPWALEVLEESGFAYDASVFPMRTYLYGTSSAQRFPHRPKLNGRTLDLLEVPASTVHFMGRNFAFAGGFYLRVLPSGLFFMGVRRLEREGQPTVVYLHPREIDPGQPKPQLALREKIIHHYGVSTFERKLVRALGSLKFTSIEERLGVS